MNQRSVLVLAALALYLCQAFAEPVAIVREPPSVAVIDDLDRAVYMEETPQRIVSLSPANTEMLFALGLRDRIVGATKYCNYPPDVELLKDAGNITVVGGFKNPDMEKIASLQPDLVVASMVHAKDVVPALERAGITVFVIRPNNLTEILMAIERLGRINRREEEASELVEGMESSIRETAGKVAGLERPRVFYAVWHDPLKTAGAGTFEDEIIDMAGGENIFRDISGYALVDAEAIAARDPEVIIVCTGMGSGAEGPLLWARDNPVLADTSARKSSRIHQADGDLVTRAGPRIVDALEMFARLIHPEAF